MKIAFVFDGLGFGGIERVGIDYIHLLKEKGYLIDVYNLNPKAYEMEKELADKIRVIHFKMSRKVCPYIYTVAKRKWWWGKFIYPFAFIILSCYQKLKKLAHSIDESYDVVVAFSGHFNDLTFVSENYLSTNQKVCWLHGGLEDYIQMGEGYLFLYKKIKNLVVLTSSSEITETHYPDLHIEKIYNPTFVTERKLDIFKIEKLQKLYGNFLLVVGRFTKEKDQKTVLRAVKILAEEYNIHENVLFLGDGPEKEETEKYALKLGIKDQAFFMGSCFDVQNYYSAAHIVVHSSPAEGLPTVLLEAMAYGVPIVATESRPGVPEVLGEGGKYGIICGIGDSKAMAEGVYHLISNKEEYQHYQIMENERLKDFLPETISQKIDNFFRNLV